MNKKHRITLVLVAVMFLVAACATTQTGTPDSYLQTQYKMLAASQEAYNVSWGAFKQLYDTKAVNKAGKLIIDQDRYQAGLQIANTYYSAWMGWIDAVMEYEKTKGASGTLTVEQKAAMAQKIAAQLLTLIQPYIQQSIKLP